jgi:methylenetetrahydrofolate dehydrogenase (NADP+)/methenyltetrahydrofolate cyclohydrolase
VIGRSDIVGKPVALLLLHRHATVTVCHSRTPDLASISRTADVLVAAIGRPGFVTKEMVKPGAAVIDVGINRLDRLEDVGGLYGFQSERYHEFVRRGFALTGDVHPEVSRTAGSLTPVPGGVGPVTIAMLLKNTLAAAQLSESSHRPAIEA